MGYRYTLHTGRRVMDLTAGSEGVHMEQGGAQNLPVASPQRLGVELVDEPGEHETGVVFPRTSGSFTVTCHPHKGKSAAEVEQWFKRELAARGGFEFWVTGDGGRPRRQTQKLVRFSAPATQPEHAGFIRLTVDVDAMDPLFYETDSETGTVDVINTGVVKVWVNVWWEEGGSLVMPSGAISTLPTVAEPRTLVLNPHESCVVIDEDGVPDRDVWGTFPTYPEAVMPGKFARFSAPAGALVSWRVGYTDPWGGH